MSSEEYSLKKSMEKLGVLVPVIKNKRTGHLIDGKHRLQDKPDAPVFEVDIPEELEGLARLAINNVRRNGDNDAAEWYQILENLDGKKPQDVADMTGLNISTVYRHWPQELKDPDKVKAGQASGSVRTCEQTVKTQENHQAIRVPATTDFLACGHCGRSTHITKLTNVGDKDVCPICKTNFYRNYHAPFKESRKDEPTYKETWEQRKAEMSPGISKMDSDMLVRLQNNRTLRDDGWKVVFQKHYVIKEVVSDLTLEKDDREIPIFWDGPVHVGREDRDEANRTLLSKFYPNARPLTFPYKADSDKEKVALETQVVEALKLEQ